MTNLHELTKQLDVLTWNSRSVLNALIRSAMAAGSSDGFTVTRAEEQITLDRMDIYKLYHFYEAWEATQFNEDDFETIRSKMNEEYPDCGIDHSLAQHAKIMWMDKNNAGLTDEEWIEKVKNLSNPKWFTNTAPIPLNIRTPIYDENLSTKTYDSYETYLFPSAYYSIDTLGHSGDGVDHGAGGKTWTFNVDDVFTIDTNRVLLGTQDKSLMDLYSTAYSPDTPIHSVEGGVNSFAFTPMSFAFGSNNRVGGDSRSAVLGGHNNLVTGAQSAIIGGIGNIVSSYRSGIVGGMNNLIGSGDTAFAANSLNSVGGYSYPFTRFVSSSSETQTKCDEVREIDGCVYNRVKNVDASTSADGLSLSPNQVYISYNARKNSGIGYNQISAGNSEARYSWFDFKPEDTVVLYGFDTGEPMLRACEPMYARVVDIAAWTNTGLKDISQGNTVALGTVYGYVITLNANVTSENIDGLGDGAVQAGYLVRQYASAYPITTPDGRLRSVDQIYSLDCSVLGYNNISCGSAQCVVGSSNIELIQPRFIVGSGSSYISANDFNRSNSFVSAPNYTYMQTSNYIVSGVAMLTTAQIHGDGTYSSTRIYDEDWRNGVEKYNGFFAYSKNERAYRDEEDAETRAVLRVFHEKSLLAIGTTGILLYEPYVDDSVTPNNSTRTVWNEVYSKNGSVAIHSGSKNSDVNDSTTADDNWDTFYEKYVKRYDEPGKDNTVTIWGKDAAGIHGQHLYLHASEESGYIYMQSAVLKIRCDTRQSLTAQPNDTGIEPFTQGARTLDTITNTGHVYTTQALSGMNSDDFDIGTWVGNPYFDAYHVFTSSKLVDQQNATNVYDVAQIVLPGNVTCDRSVRGTANIPHPVVMAYKVYKDDSSMANTRFMGNGGYIYEELAYKSDIVSHAVTQVCNNIATASYFDDMTMYDVRIDPDPLVIGTDRIKQYDNFMSYMDAHASTSYHQSISIVDCTTLNNYCGYIIRAKSMSGSAGLIADCNPVGIQGPTYYRGHFVDGVELNPAMTMEVIDGNITAGITYLAYAPGSLYDEYYEQFYDDDHPEARIQNIYMANLANVSGIVSRSLYTSKYSRGTEFVNVVDCRDVWVCALQDDSNTKVGWYPLMHNLVMSVAGGHLTVEFELNIKTMNNFYAMPIKCDNPANIIEPDDSASGSDVYELSKGSQTIVLPVDPSIGNLMNTAYNQNTGVVCKLTGRMYYTGNTNIYVTGSFQKRTPGHGYDRSQGLLANDQYCIPCVVIDIGGLDDNNLDEDYKFYVKLEGVVDYAG